MHVVAPHEVKSMNFLIIESVVSNSMLRIELPCQWRSNMKTISMTAIALVFALSAIAFDAGAAKASPIVPHGHVCLDYTKGGTGLRLHELCAV
jgi:hypothetical protein